MTPGVHQGTVGAGIETIYIRQESNHTIYAVRQIRNKLPLNLIFYILHSNRNFCIATASVR